jgi:hypothetical protein
VSLFDERGLTEITLPHLPGSGRRSSGTKCPLELTRPWTGSTRFASSVSREELHAEELVRAHRGLSAFARAFRIMTIFTLEVGSIRHGLTEGVRAHVFVRMLARYVR